MNTEDCEKVELVAEVTVQRFFTHYLETVFPHQLAAAITAHNGDITAHTRQIHEAVKTESYRLKLWLIGAVFIGGLGSGVGIAKALAFVIQ